MSGEANDVAHGLGHRVVSVWFLCRWTQSRRQGVLEGSPLGRLSCWYNWQVSQPSESGSPAQSQPGWVPLDPGVAELRTPRAAAVAGIAFALILTAALVLVHLALPAGSDRSQWITNDGRRQQVTRALQLIPFAGIAFLWFIGVIRSRLGTREDKLFATAFLGSGLLLVAMMFIAAADLAGLLLVYDQSHSLPADQVRLVGAISTVLLTTFWIRMAAVFTLVVTNLGRRSGLVPRWLQVLGFASALVMLFAPPGPLWTILVFPIWVFLVSVHFLFSSWGAPKSSVTVSAAP